MKIIESKFPGLTRRKFLSLSAVMFVAGNLPRFDIYASPSNRYLCRQGCCVDHFFTDPEEMWLEQGRPCPTGARRCGCGYVPCYRNHVCPEFHKGFNLLLTTRHQIWGWHRFEGIDYPIYSCNGLHYGYEWIETTMENYDAMRVAVEELEQQRHEILSRRTYDGKFV